MQGDLDTSIENWETNRKTLKKNWRKNVDCARTNSGLDVRKELRWFEIVHPVLADTNTVIDILSSSALYLSFQAENLSTESRNEKNNKETSDKQNGITLSERKLH